MRFQQIVLNKNEETDSWDLTLIGIKLDQSIKIMNEVIDNQKNLYQPREYNEWQGKK